MDNDVKSFDWLPEKDERVVIPFRDKNKNLTFIQGRAIGDSTFRYMTIELNPSDNYHHFSQYVPGEENYISQYVKLDKKEIAHIKIESCLKLKATKNQEAR